jgi:uncharacterized protein
MSTLSQREPSALTKIECDSSQSAVPPWARSGYEAFCRTIESQAPGFPCIYGVRTYNENGLRFAFIRDDTTLPGLDELGQVVWDYSIACREIGQFTTLATFFPATSSELATLGGYRRRYWRILQWLIEHDPAPWPKDVPVDPSDPDWEFCFGGLPMFAPANLPIYVRRRSRRNPCFMILFQPRFVFDELIAQPRKLAAARRVIRARALAFDDVPVHPAIGVYGEGGNLEWKQYVLPDSSEPVTGECPLKPRRWMCQ